jgi:hypothetical protein
MWVSGVERFPAVADTLEGGEHIPSVELGYVEGIG